MGADIDTLVEGLARLRNRAVPLLLARQERRRHGATPAERLTTTQHIALLALADGPRSISEVAEATGVAVSTATRMVQSLARDGWVDRPEPAPGEDRRRRPVCLTAAGRGVMEEADAIVRRRFRALLVRLDEGERTAILAGLAALTKAIQEDDAAEKADSISSSPGAGGDSGVAPPGRMPSRITPR
jgi:DNA-binding MarR family transcriptional regulator